LIIMLGMVSRMKAPNEEEAENQAGEEGEPTASFGVRRRDSLAASLRDLVCHRLLTFRIRLRIVLSENY